MDWIGWALYRGWNQPCFWPSYFLSLVRFIYWTSGIDFWSLLHQRCRYDKPDWLSTEAEKYDWKNKLDGIVLDLDYDSWVGGICPYIMKLSFSSIIPGMEYNSLFMDGKYKYRGLAVDFKPYTSSELYYVSGLLSLNKAPYQLQLWRPIFQKPSCTLSRDALSRANPFSGQNYIE